MSKAVKDDIEINYYTFEEFVEYGKKQTEGSTIVNDNFYFFTFRELIVARKSEDWYLMYPPNHPDHITNITPDRIIILREEGFIVCKKEELDSQFKLIKLLDYDN